MKKTRFSLFLEGFRRPVRPPLWRNRRSLAFSVPVIRVKKTWFSLFLEDFRRPVRPPVHAGALSVCDTREKKTCFSLFLEGFRRPVGPPLWRNRPSLAFSVPVTREKDVSFSIS